MLLERTLVNCVHQRLVLLVDLGESSAAPDLRVRIVDVQREVRRDLEQARSGVRSKISFEKLIDMATQPWCPGDDLG